MKTTLVTAFAVLVSMFSGCTGRTSNESAIIDADSLLPDNPRTHYARSVNDAPADGERVKLNPPRFRWRFHPDGDKGGNITFLFQVSSSRGFETPDISILTPFNFYNTIAPLDGPGPFLWRVGYIDDAGASSEPFHWTEAKSFTIAEDAVEWDRSLLADPDFGSKPHPRILLSADVLEKLRGLIVSDPETRTIFDRIRAVADETLAQDWYRNFPENDIREAPELFYTMGHRLCHVAFVYRVTGEELYASVIPRAATYASYEKGNRSSPEPMGESGEDSTQNTEFLALLYDWLYPDLTVSQRATFINSLNWRIDHFVNEFAWKRKIDGVRSVHFNGSLATTGASHSFEGFWDTFPAALAIYEDSEAARECFHLGVNWMTGVSSSHGFDEGWNEGPGYSNSKFKWILNGMQYLDSVFPEYGVGNNPWLKRIGEWFVRVTPVGMKHAPWGHQSNRQNYYDYNRINNFRRFAYLTGDGVILNCWNDLGGPERYLRSSARIWSECVLKANYSEPQVCTESDPIGLFPLGGWVMAGTKPPSSRDCYENSVGMIFQSSLGAYSHSFGNENSFHLYAYGEDVSFAAGTSEYEAHAFHSMTHNTILVDGLGQSQTKPPETPRVGYIRAFDRGDEYLYWAGDATNAYQKRPLERSGDWWGRLDPIYESRDLAHFERFIRHVVFVKGKYFVLFDDLSAARPSQYTWLYHILPADPIQVDTERWTIDYSVGNVPVRVMHVAHRDDLDLIDMQGDDGFKNPLTDEDYTNVLGRHPTGIRREEHIVGHNLYISNKTKCEDFHFLSVISPVQPGEKFPEITRIDDYTVVVDGYMVSFDPGTVHPADLIVDVPALRAESPAMQ
jgi:hypothetical protein